MIGRVVSQPVKLNLFFDDRCNLCHGTMRFLAAVDWFKRIRPMPVSRSLTELANAGISLDEATNDLFGIDPVTGRSRSGYDLYVYLSRRIVLLYPAFPILFCGYAFGIGPFVYRFIANRRRRIWGTCEIDGNGKSTGRSKK